MINSNRLAAESIGKLQSPAVDVPDPSDIDVYRWFQESTIAHHIEEDGSHIPKRAMFLAKKAIAFAYTSPRITEQDAPITLTDEQVAVLGRPNFACSSIARVLVNKGVYAEIPPRSENEQAVAIHFLNSMLEKHGSNWRLEAEKVLNKLNDKPDSVGG